MARSYQILTLALFLWIGPLQIELNAQQYPQLSKSATISLMTCGPGAELYSTFGHCALWVNDPVSRIDRIYNYGTFDFSDPNFYIKFTRGIADYMLSITTSARFMQEYIDENRTVEQQILNLSTEEKQKLFETLEDNYKPENRFYRYDFLFLNCSSIIRDKVFETTVDRFSLDTTEYKESFRDLLQSYYPNPWIGMGIDLLLGHKTDRNTENWERMFLPDYMRDQFALAFSENDKSGLTQPVKTIYLSSNPPLQNHKRALITLPEIIFFVLFIFVGLLTKKKLTNRNWNRWMDLVIFTLSGIIGLLLAFMGFFSEHEVTHQNINLLWAFPLNLIFVVLIWFPRMNNLIRNYAKVLLGFGIIFFALAFIGFQHVPISILLFAGIVLLRLFRYALFPKISNQIES